MQTGPELQRVRRPAPRPAFTLAVAADGPETVVAPTGELDLAAADGFEREVRRLVDDGRALVIDLRGVDFLDSAGLRALLTLRNDAKRQGRELALLPGPPEVQRVFQVTVTRSLFDWRAEDRDHRGGEHRAGP